MAPAPDQRNATRLDAAARMHARLDGRRSGLVEQEKALSIKVGTAKGRNAIRKDVETFIEQVQSEAYSKTTQTYSTLLTTLSAEVLPHSHPIDMDLTTERGLPALHLSVRSPNGIREDVFEDHGGALNNVIGMGLRLIAVVKAGGKRFLALDEPECWVKPDRIPAFFNVLADSARRLGVQTIAITHHDDAANFGPEVRISTLRGSPELGARIETDRAPHEWNEADDAFRWIRLRNFQTFVDTTMQLGPGVNALVGPNDHGKSGVIRALRAAFYGETRDSLIRHGTKEAIVDIGLANGRFLRFRRSRQGNPKNLWSLHDANESVVEENGNVYETKGNKPPEWVDRMFGLHEVENLDIHLAHQKHPVFLLDRPASQRASVLAIGQEAGYTSDMLAIHKETTSRNNAIIRDGEEAVGKLRQEIESLRTLDEIGELIEHARGSAENVQAWKDYVDQIERIATALAAARTKHRNVQERAATYAALIPSEDFDAARQEIQSIQSATRTSEELRRTRTMLATARRRHEAMSELPAALPQPSDERAEAVLDRLAGLRHSIAMAKHRQAVLAALPDSLPILESPAGETAAVRLVETRSRLAEQEGRRAQLIDESSEIRKAMDDLLSTVGGHCPTCGHVATADDMLHDHSHEEA